MDGTETEMIDWLTIAKDVGFGALALYLIAVALPRIVDKFIATVDRMETRYQLLQSGFADEAKFQRQMFREEMKLQREEFRTDLREVISVTQHFHELKKKTSSIIDDLIHPRCSIVASCDGFGDCSDCKGCLGLEVGRRFVAGLSALSFSNPMVSQEAVTLTALTVVS